MDHLQVEQSGRLSYVVRPPSPAVHGLAPVLIFLHGYDEGAPRPVADALVRHGPLKPEASARAGQFVVVAPQLPQRGDVWFQYAADVRRIAADAYRHFGGDPARTYLTGFGFGGNGVFDLAVLMPTMWAALWPVDPTRIPPASLEMPVWLSVGDAARPAVHHYAEMLELEPAGPEPKGHRIYLDEGADHTGSATLAYASGRAYEWLLRWSRPSTAER